MTDPLVLLGLQVCTPVGPSACTTAAELRAGTNEYHALEDDLSPDPLVVCRWRAVPDVAKRGERLMALASVALTTHLRAVSAWPPLVSSPVPLFLSVTAKADELASLVEYLQATAAAVAPKLSLVLPDETIDVFMQGGRVGFLVALERAMASVSAGKHAVALVGAVDSSCDDDTIAKLARTERLLSASNTDGLIPGEAAAFGLVTSAAVAKSWSRGGLRLMALSRAREPHPFSQNKEPNLGLGLTQAFAGLGLQAGAATLGIYSCQTSESYWTQELSQACLRNSSLLPEPLRVDALGMVQGDVGAAAAAVQLARIEHGGEQGRALVYSCRDDGLCVACMVEPMTPPESMFRRLSVIEALAPLARDGFVDGDLFTTRLCERIEMHQAEIGFLLTQRQVALADDSRCWTDAAKAEIRIVAAPRRSPARDGARASFAFRAGPEVDRRPGSRRASGSTARGTTSRSRRACDPRLGVSW